jgi:hypothetical protein
MKTRTGERKAREAYTRCRAINLLLPPCLQIVTPSSTPAGKRRSPPLALRPMRVTSEVNNSRQLRFLSRAEVAK